MKKIKRVISFLVVIVLLCSIISIQSYAITPGNQRFGAWLMSMLMAYNITLNSTLAPLNEMLDYIAGPPIVEYLYPATNWEEDIMNRSSIVISDEIVTIDGVDYRNVWLSHDAAEKFRVNALDFATAYDMTSETEGTFASGVGHWDGEPVYEIVIGSSTVQQTVKYNVPTVNNLPVSGNYPFGNANVNYNTSGSSSRITIQWSNGQSSGKTVYMASRPFYIQGRSNEGPYRVYGASGSNDYFTVPTDLRDNTHFDFDWVAGEVDLDTPIPEDYGLWTRVPDSTIQDIHDTYPDIYPDTTVKTPINFDFDLPDIGDKLGILWDILDILIDLLKDSPQVVEPTIGPVDDEPIPPTPGQDTISNTPWESLVQEFNRIIQAIQNIPNTFNTLFSNIISAIQTLQQSIVSKLDSILQSLTDLADKIETGVTDLFKDFLTGLENIFRPILLRIAQALGIWHYVVEWIASIGTTFIWIWSILSGASTNIILPIYACIAAAICLAFYKRFGR